MLYGTVFDVNANRDLGSGSPWPNRIYRAGSNLVRRVFDVDQIIVMQTGHFPQRALHLPSEVTWLVAQELRMRKVMTRVCT